MLGVFLVQGCFIHFRVSIFQGCPISGVYLFQGCTYFKGAHISGVSLFQGCPCFRDAIFLIECFNV